MLLGIALGVQAMSLVVLLVFKIYAYRKARVETGRRLAPRGEVHTRGLLVRPVGSAGEDLSEGAQVTMTRRHKIIRELAQAEVREGIYGREPSSVCPVCPGCTEEANGTDGWVVVRHEPPLCRTRKEIEDGVPKRV